MKKFRISQQVYAPLLVIIVGTIIPMFFFNGVDADILFGIATYSLMIFVAALFIRFLIIRTGEKKDENRIAGRLVYNLDDADVYLVDYENTGHFPKEITKTDENTVYYLFAGKNQHEKIKKDLWSASIKSKTQVIYVSHTGKNLLDIGLGMYLGAIYSLYRPKNVYIYSKDNGYSVLVQIADELGYHNTFIVSPEKDIHLNEKDIDSIYEKIVRHSTETHMSLGNFKKRIKKTKMNITADETNYVVKKLAENNMIEIVDKGKYSDVVLK